MKRPLGEDIPNHKEVVAAITHISSKSGEDGQESWTIEAVQRRGQEIENVHLFVARDATHILARVAIGNVRKINYINMNPGGYNREPE